MKKLYKKILLTMISFIVISMSIYAQTPFQRVYSNLRGFQSIQKTTDGGYIAAGNNLQQASLFKFDANINIVWCKTYTGTDALSFNSVQQTTDGGYVAAGAITNSVTYNGKFYLARFDANGDTLWTKYYGTTEHAIAYSVKQTSDGGFIIGGESYYGSSSYMNVYVIKTDVDGNIVWSKVFGSSTNSFSCNEIQITSDGGFVLTGSSNYSTYGEILVIKLNPVGDTLWTRGFCQSGGFMGNPIGKSIIQTSDGGYFVLGNTESGMVVATEPLIKLNANGDTTWTKTLNFSGVFSVSCNLTSVIQSADGGLVIAGSAMMGGGIGGYSYATLIKTDINGDTLWSKKYGQNCYFYSLVQTNDGGYLLAGMSNDVASGAYLIKTDGQGNTFCDNGTASFTVAYSPITKYKGFAVNSGGVVSRFASTIGTLGISHINPCLPTPSICIVTVDSVLQKNLIVWEKNIDMTLVASFNVYKETTTGGVYALAGNVPATNLSTFVDNASNPAQKADRYELATVDADGIESYSKSAAHKTIHLNINLGVPPQINLIWDNYEGFTVSTYRIWRGNASGMTLLDSVQGTLTSYSDLTPPTTDSLYFIEITHTPCNPLAKSYTSTKSNVVSSRGPSGIGIDENKMANNLSVYPNPANNTIYINGLSTPTKAEIFNISGKLLLSKQLTTNQIDISTLAKGLYFIKLSNEEGSVVRRFVKE